MPCHTMQWRCNDSALCASAFRSPVPLFSYWSRRLSTDRGDRVTCPSGETLKPFQEEDHGEIQNGETQKCGEIPLSRGLPSFSPDCLAHRIMLAVIGSQVIDLNT